jgi:type 1 glutamine amidotransferase
MWKNRVLLPILFFLLIGCVLPVQPEQKKRLLAIGMSAGFQHDSVSDALATMYDLGKQSGLWETYIRTDTQLITKQSLELNARNLEYFDAIFFMTSGELPLDDDQKADFLSFIREDGKGFLGAHSATDTLTGWPEFGELIGGYFDGHPWNQFDATIKVEDPEFPAVAHFPASFVIFDEIYQIKNFSRSRHRVIMSLDMTKVNLNQEGVTHSEVPITWVREYGKGRVFYCGLGHPPEVWSNPDVRKMWLEAVKWALDLSQADASPRR